MNRQKAWVWLFSAIFALGFVLISPRVWAQDRDDDWNQGDDWNQQNDPPSRVARMNFVQGSVSFQPGGEGDWVDAVPNRPLTTGDNLWSDRGSRAEMHVGSTAIRLGSETSMTFLELDDRVTQLRVAQGSVIVRVRHLDDDDIIEIDTPNIAFRVRRTGEYRVDVNPNGRTSLVDVYQGRGEVIGGGNNYTVVANQQASFTGDPDDGLGYDVNPLPWSDSFTDWAFQRDRREDHSPSANYVSPEMTGWEDLDDNGSWSYAGSYGTVWYPTAVPVGWAPYRYGHWVWVAPWGWTWVDDAPWGFAPFHYGRWCMIGPRWAWIPGPVAVRPVYAPALVAWVGGRGFNFSISIGGGGGVGWFPLGPGEVFVPAYHVSRGYVNQVNVTNTVVNVTKVTNVYNTYTTNNVTNVTNINYVNRTNVTVVSHDTFVNARPVARNVVQVQARDLQAAPVTHVAAFEPVHTSVMGAGRVTTVAPPAVVINRQVVAAHTPVPPVVPFAQRQDKLMVRPATPVTPAAQPVVRPQPGMRPEQPITRTESSPSQPQPVNRPPQPGMTMPPAQTERPVQPAPRPEWQTPRPGNQPQSGNQPPQPRPETGQQPMPQPQSRPQPQMNAPRENQQPARPWRNPEDQTGPQQGWSHPQARPAPPVQPKSENQAREEENKYRNWQQQARPQPQQQPQARPQPPAKPAPAKSQDKQDKQDKKDDHRR